MNVKNINSPKFETMEYLDLIQTFIRPTGQPAHSPLDPGYIRIEAILHPSIQVHMDCGLSNGEVKLEITQEEALQLAPMLMQTIQKLMEEELPEELHDRLLDEINRRAEQSKEELPEELQDRLLDEMNRRTELVKEELPEELQDRILDEMNRRAEQAREELPEELQDRLLDEMNHRAERALSEIPQGEYTALAEATLKRIHKEDSTNREPLVEHLGEDRTEDLEP